jgi:hypothetical protein
MRLSASRTKRPSSARRGAALFALVLLQALVIGVLGLSALTICRLERQQRSSSGDMLRARRHAAAALELGLLNLKNDAKWRTTYRSGQALPELTFGNGSLSWIVIDPIDGSLSNSAEDRVLLQGIGKVGNSVWSESIEAIPTGGPPVVLNRCLHAQQSVTIASGSQLTVGGAALSTSGPANVWGTVFGDVECASRSGNGSISGTLSANEPPKGVFSSAVFDQYKAAATTLSFSSTMTKKVLTAAVNTYGGSTNSDGLYYINANGGNFTISGSRVEATLVVNGNVIVDSAVLMKASRSNWPTLIVKGNLTIQINSGSTQLKESAWNTNFNPSNAPYAGSSDSDTNDSYPNQIQGFCHVLGNVTFSGSPQVVGTIVCNGQATVSGTVNIQHDSSFYSNPPSGYESTTGPNLKMTPNTWKRIAVP